MPQVLSEGDELTGLQVALRDMSALVPRCPDMVRSFMCGTRRAFRRELVAVSQLLERAQHQDRLLHAARLGLGAQQ